MTTPDPKPPRQISVRTFIIVLVACASVGMALFSATVWLLALATSERAQRAFVQAPATNLPRARAVPSSRSVKNAPILNSPAAE